LRRQSGLAFRLGRLEIKVLSNRADLVSGGDRARRSRAAEGADSTDLHVDVDGRDVSSAFKQGTGGRIVGSDYRSERRRKCRHGEARQGRRSTHDYQLPIGGPIFSGTQVQPWVCATPAAQMHQHRAGTNASGLSAAATDAQCNIPSEDHLLLSHDRAVLTAQRQQPVFQAIRSERPAACGCRRATNDQGVKVKFIVRVERGVMNRAIYDMAVLFDPGRRRQTQDWQHGTASSYGRSAAAAERHTSSSRPTARGRSTMRWPAVISSR
jgi:hypothetical protein